MANPKSNTGTLSRTDQEVEHPRKYKVIFHNDDYTTQEFVVSVLMSVFHRDEATAFQIMMHVHEKGFGVAGIYTREVGETKVAQTIALARKNDFPLELTLEPE